VTPVARALLILSAILCGGWVTLLGAGFNIAVEPEEYTFGAALFWMAIGAVFAAPFWVPALIAGRHPELLGFTRIAGAFLIASYTYLFGSILMKSLERMWDGYSIDSHVLASGFVLTFLCLVSLGILLWPHIRVIAKYRP
jgi:hypothetical protein